MTRLPHLRRPTTTEEKLFTAAAAAAVVHALDDAFLGRQPGVGLGQHALAGVLSLLIGVAAIALYPRARPGVRSALAVALGFPALVNGAMHVAHIGLDTAERSDLTGVLATVAGLVLIGLGASTPWRHRGRGAATARGRWITRVVAVPAGLVVAALIVVPISVAVLETHKPREPIGDPPSAAYRDVTFRASDGLRMSGWYLPSRNGAAVLVVHGGGGDRSGAVGHARMLARHGYGVLLYDSRGRGESEGTPNSGGWDWEKDAFGALDFVRRQPDVRGGRIGALGLSSGADTVLELGARRRGLSAIVADGAAARTFEDGRRIGRGGGPDGAMAWVMFKSIGVLSGQAPSRPLMDLVPRIHGHTLLVSGDRGPERDFMVAYEKAGQGRVQHWNLPDAGHTAALRKYPQAYERRVTAFLDGLLLERQG
jgi:hypothetical protein